MAPHPQRLTVTRRAWPLAQRLSRSRAAARPAPRSLSPRYPTASFAGAANACRIRAMARASTASSRALEAMKGAVFSGLDRHELQRVMPPGAARNALDCAFWDLDAKRDNRRAADLAGIAVMRPVVTAYTLSLDTPERMGEAAALQRHRPLLKLKLSGDGDIERVRAVRERAPAARLIVDPNEGWRERHLIGGHAGACRIRRGADRAAAAGREMTTRSRRCRTRSRSAPTRPVTRPEISTVSPASTTRSTSSSTRPAG